MNTDKGMEIIPRDAFNEMDEGASDDKSMNRATSNGVGAKVNEGMSANLPTR